MAHRRPRSDQGWHDTGHFDGDTLVLVEAEDQYQTTVSPDRDGRYPVGAGAGAGR
jgi:hypothetical protein